MSRGAGKEDEMVGCLNGREFEQALGNGEGMPGKPGMLQSVGLRRVGHN